MFAPEISLRGPKCEPLPNEKPGYFSFR